MHTALQSVFVLSPLKMSAQDGLDVSLFSAEDEDVEYEIEMDILSDVETVDNIPTRSGPSPDSVSDRPSDDYRPRPNSPEEILSDMDIFSDADITDFMPTRAGPRPMIVPESDESRPNTPGSDSSDEDLSTKRSRKRKKNIDAWKATIRMRRRESGKNYVDRRGQNHKSKTVGRGCHDKCRMKCMQHFDKSERQKIHEAFWSLSDSKKSHYYTKYVERKPKCRVRTLANKSKKTYSFSYFLEMSGDRVRVCKTFFLNTLDISQNRLYYCFDNFVDSVRVGTGIPRSPLKGKVGSRATSVEKIETVKRHIQSFPKIESHYCRSSSVREYLDGRLSIRRMYDLYVEHVGEVSAVKFNVYSKVFNNDFNLSFLKPKKDRCDFCQEMAVASNPSDDLKEKHEAHLKRKLEGKEERDKDRLAFKSRQENTTTVVTFDLQNVFALPKANVSNFYYKRKLNTYNLTAHNSVNGKTYCALWHECISGRAGNHIASAIYSILKRLVHDCPNVNHIILWSDSCIPQNKNSLMALALKKFMEENVTVDVIEQKFGEPGHGNVQEIDAVHSRIERYLKTTEIFSPLSLVRNLLAIPKGKVHLEIIQLHAADFLNFKTAAASLNFVSVPFTKVKHLKYHRDKPFKMHYRNSFNDEFTKVCLNRQTPKRKTKRNEKANRQLGLVNLPKVSIVHVNETAGLSEEKKKDIRSMLQYMPALDVQFFKALLK